ncbi:MAG: hypothetical protein AABW64_03250 [Nanoarchaeota archaeon]
MVQKEVIIDNIKIVQDSIFAMGELYKMMFKWFEAYEYGFHEDEYNEETKQTGKNVKIYWTAEKKIDAYVKFVIEIGMFALNMNDADIERGGLKIKSNKANIEFRISAYLRKDYADKWKNLHMFHYIYDKVIVQDRIDKYGGELYRETNKLIDEIKAFLNLHRL